LIDESIFSSVPIEPGLWLLDEVIQIVTRFTGLQLLRITSAPVLNRHLLSLKNAEFPNMEVHFRECYVTDPEVGSTPLAFKKISYAAGIVRTTPVQITKYFGKHTRLFETILTQSLEKLAINSTRDDIRDIFDLLMPLHKLKYLSIDMRSLHYLIPRHHSFPNICSLDITLPPGKSYVIPRIPDNIFPHLRTLKCPIGILSQSANVDCPIQHLTVIVNFQQLYSSLQSSWTDVTNALLDPTSHILSQLKHLALVT
jgi:hypothetical protein